MIKAATITKIDFGMEGYQDIVSILKSLQSSSWMAQKMVSENRHICPSIDFSDNHFITANVNRKQCVDSILGTLGTIQCILCIVYLVTFMWHCRVFNQFCLCIWVSNLYTAHWFMWLAILAQETIIERQVAGQSGEPTQQELEKQ